MNSNQEKADITKFFQTEAAGGVLLVSASILAVIFANSPLNPYYMLLIDTPVMIQVGALEISKPLLLWVNDGLMAVFFLLVGLELKRELLEGELSDKKKIIMPGLGAIGGMIVPAAIYTAFNGGDPVAGKGWAIPAATDIAFALGVLSLLGSRVPNSLKVFLTSLAVFDDIGAILIIAIFYTSKLSFLALAIAGLCICVLYFFNKRGVAEKSLYVTVGIIMWVAMLKSGVHATLAGVLLALFIPMKLEKIQGASPLKDLEDDLHSAVIFFILPVFAFCNAGINFSGLGSEQILHSVPLGIALGLFFGNQIGVFGLCWLGIKLKLAELPSDVSMLSLYGVSALCGIGFTMSFFIGSLAFEEAGVNLIVDERLGIILGSIASAALGYAVLRFSLKDST
ncbi:Na+/H+ antiporter NhaA type [hydrothermal vent metagenome]|uniref:Na+/H+ antiporter NhaA type n=1 Tax=hydrothermal vent metagenome TaxID=652676 RepID=A0A3B1D5P6_9ZZZZ